MDTKYAPKGIITWNNIPFEEQNIIIKRYFDLINDKNNLDVDADTSTFMILVENIEQMEMLFGKENLNHQFKTWEDVERKCPNIKTETDTLNYHISTCIAFDDKIERKLIATYKISKLIEIGYGGRVTDDEWRDDTLDKFSIGWIEDGKCPFIRCHYHRFQDDFISFHTKQQAEKFMSYVENIKLINDYYMID